MNAFRARIASPVPATAFSLGAGIWLFFLLSWLESSVLPGLGGVFALGPANALAEELGKLCLFPLFRLFCRLTRHGADDPAPPGIFALLAVMTFAIVENSVYFFRFPTSYIYLRLPYSYTIHLVTGTAFALADLGSKRLYYPLLLAAATLYHFALNSLSLAVSSPLLLGIVGTANVLLFALLAASFRNRLTVRRFMHAGN
jgi:hypothetical protein